MLTKQQCVLTLMCAHFKNIVVFP